MARSGDEVAAGDGLGAFGAALILPVQMHCRGGRAAAVQWIYEKRSSIEEPRLAENQDHQIWAELTRPPPAAQLREKCWGPYGSYRR
jgi:ATP:corrinoid adenosyltransferase